MRFQASLWQSILFNLTIVISYAFGINSYAQTPAQCNVVYAVNDKGVQDSEIFTYNLDNNNFQALGPLYVDFDLEGLDVHPITHILYASSGQKNAQLYTRHYVKNKSWQKNRI